LYKLSRNGMVRQRQTVMSNAHSIQRIKEPTSLYYRHTEASIMPVNGYECICLSNALDFGNSGLYLVSIYLEVQRLRSPSF
jgi:hypothetical protein